MDITTAAVHIATIHLLGLCFFTPQTTPAESARTALTHSIVSQQFMVIMPHVPSQTGQNGNTNATGTKASDTQKRTSIVQQPTGNASSPTGRSTATGEIPSNISAPTISGTVPATPHIQAHTALLMFKERDLLNVKGWEVTRLDTGFLSIQLNGEQLSFETDAANQDVKPILGLGHLVAQELRSQFKPPSYSDAAAVFSIPTGTLTACRKVFVPAPPVPTAIGRVPLDSAPLDPVPLDPTRNRIDTELTLNNGGTLTIRAGTKRLTVSGDATLIAANIPMGWAEGKGVESSGIPHNTVYCMMMAGDCAIPALTKQASDTIKPCNDTSGMRVPSGVTLPSIPARIDSLIDFACSNTQWP